MARDLPKRIQLSRRKGYRKPEGAVVVARPTKWGNPFLVGEGMTRAEAVWLYEAWMTGSPIDPLVPKPDPSELRGKDLACWCPLDQPCHADVLLKLANGGEA